MMVVIDAIKVIVFQTLLLMVTTVTELRIGLNNHIKKGSTLGHGFKEYSWAKVSLGLNNIQLGLSELCPFAVLLITWN